VRDYLDPKEAGHGVCDPSAGTLRCTRTRRHNGEVVCREPSGDNALINSGFFVLNPQAYRHSGFWQPMDTLGDKMHIESLWQSGRAPWRVWS
jgi:hypothetical protein